MTTLPRELEAELRSQVPESELSDYEDTAANDRERFYPKPEVTDVLALREWLQEFYRPLHEGHDLYSAQAQREKSKYTGIVGLRKLRYGLDETSEKLYARLSNDIRVRSMQSHKLIFQVRSLLSRNPMSVVVPALSGAEPALEKAQKETRWANELANAFERRGVFSPIQESDDAQCEAFGGWEFYLRDAWDEIELDPNEDEVDENGMPKKDYQERVSHEKREKGLPFGIRALDPLSTLIDPTDDGEGINAAIIVERKRRRPTIERIRGKNPEAYLKIAEGGFGQSGFDTNADPLGEVECIRYYDPVWYVYIVEGTMVECVKHGLPGVPIFPAWGFITSARNMGDKFQGVAYALQQTEALANDALTQELDAQITYNRVKPIAEADGDASSPDMDVLDLSGPELSLLPPGYKVHDAFGEFRSSQASPAIGLALGLGEAQSSPDVLAGASPGADTSGYSLNLMTQNAIGPYSPLLTNKARGWGNMIDFIRKTVKYTLKQSVPLPIVGSDGANQRVEWLELSPDDITDIPCVVTVDPTSDLEKIALSKWLGEGVAGSFVPQRVLQERGYGSDDAQAWDDEIIRDKAKRLFGDRLVQIALAELEQDYARANGQPPQGSGLVGPDGQTPISSQGMQEAGGSTPEPRPSTIGKGNEGTAGQMPVSQPTMAAQQGMVPGA